MEPAEQVRQIRNFISHNDNIFSDYRTSFLKFLINTVRAETITGNSTNINVSEACTIQHRHIGSTSVVIGGPIVLNPCSYRAVEEVLLQQKRQKCQGQRRWSIIECDGLPYVLGSHLIEKDKALQDIHLIPGFGHFEMNMTKSCFKL